MELVTWFNFFFTEDWIWWDMRKCSGGVGWWWLGQRISGLSLSVFSDWGAKASTRSDFAFHSHDNERQYFLKAATYLLVGQAENVQFLTEAISHHGVRVFANMYWCWMWQGLLFLLLFLILHTYCSGLKDSVHCLNLKLIMRNNPEFNLFLFLVQGKCTSMQGWTNVIFLYFVDNISIIRAIKCITVLA